MKLRLQLLVTLGLVVLIASVLWLFGANSTLFFNSEIDRLSKDELPTITIEDKSTVYCRMKADDFRFPIPPGGMVVETHITAGGFDTVAGNVRVRFPIHREMTAKICQDWVRERLQVGGRVTATEVAESNVILIYFTYYGDK